jgi:1,4-dihydroxy-2-naphthoate octaprenyltransferase
MTDRKTPTTLVHLRPLHLLTALALYLVGAGLARYLGARLQWGLFLGMLIWLVCILEGFFLLGDYVGSSFLDAVIPFKRENRPVRVEPRESSLEILLYAALALLTTAAALTVLLIIRQRLSPGVYWLMGGFFCLLSVSSLPGIPLDTSGIGEFAASISLVVFPPAIAFFTLYGGYHRYLTLVAFPLFPIHLALILTLHLRSFPDDLRKRRKTLLVRIGWVRGIFLHNLLLLSGFLLFGTALLFGLPIRIGGPVLIALIPAGYQVWYYNGLEGGAPVRWPLLISLSLTNFFIPVYLLLFSSWIY